MHRRPLLEMLDRYAKVRPEEADSAGRIAALVREHADCFSRHCLPGHVTASSWIVSSDRRQCLLTHHRKLDRWLQLGGHADGDADVAEVALREAQEESGMRHFRFVPDRHEGAVVPIDVDVHVIPERGDEPEHEHHDVRFLLVAEPGQTLQISHESMALRWFELDALGGLGLDESVWRLARKAAALLH